MTLRFGFQIACIVLLLLSGLSAPLAQAQNPVPPPAQPQNLPRPQDAPLPPEPQLPDRPVPPTQVAPVDHALEQVGDAIDTVNQAIDGPYALANATFDSAQASLPQGSIYLYRDGTGRDGKVNDGVGPDDRGPDARAGGFGNWSLVQEAGPITPVWNRQPGAAHSGLLGYTVAGPDGSYATNARSMLVTPQIDLQTDFVEPSLKGVDTAQSDLFNGLPTNAVYKGGSIVSVSQVWRLLFTTRISQINLVKATVPLPCGLFSVSAELPVAPCPFGLNAAAYPYQLRFQARFNLALGFDTVQVLVFPGDQPPSFIPLVDPNNPQAVCQPEQPPNLDYINGLDGPSRRAGRSDCTLVTPYEGYSEAATDPARPQPAFTGPSPSGGWVDYTVDLTPWAEQRVYVGFAFVSGGRVSEDAFAPNLGFKGFQVDDLQVTAPAPPVSVRVRTPSEPSYVPPGFDPRNAIIAPGVPFTAEGDVLNTGDSAVTVSINTTILDGNGTAIPGWSSDGGTVTIPAGGVHHVVAPFAGLPSSPGFLYNVTIRAVQVGAGGPAAQDPDPSNDVAGRPFRALAVQLVQQGLLQRGRDTIRLGDEVTFVLPLTNAGTVETPVTARACVVDMEALAAAADAADACSTDLLDHRPEQKVQTFTLAPHASRTLEWNVKGKQTGQFRLFVTLNDQANFNAEDLLPKERQPITSTFTSVPVALDGSLDDAAWALTPTHPLVVRDMAGAVHTGTLQVANSGDTVYLGVKLTGFGADSSVLNSLKLLAHRQADLVGAAGADDGAIVNATTSSDLHFDPAKLGWVPDAHADGPAAGRAYVPSAGAYVYEFARPLDSGDPQDLEAAPGDLLALFLEEMEYNHQLGNPATLGLIEAFLKDYHFPWEASDIDGGMQFLQTNLNGPQPLEAGPKTGLQPPSGSLDDEVASWQLVRLGAPPTDASGAVPFSSRTLSLGMGVERSPDAFFADNLLQCPNVLGWTQLNPLGVGAAVEKWNCAQYGPLGRPLIYEGVSPDSTCTPDPCQPFGDLTPPYPDISQPSASTTLATLFTPPIHVGAVQDPYLLLEHQYASKLQIHDRSGMETYSLPGRSVNIHGGGRVLLQVLDPATGLWGDSDGVAGGADILVPDANYTTERQVLPPDSRFGPRTIGTTDSGGTQCLAAQAQAAVRCGFWWPTGPQNLYQPPDENITVTQNFTGSPWRLDRFPLFGPHFGATGVQPAFVDAADRTVRFGFDWRRSAEDNPDHPDYTAAVHDYGWRIAGIAIQEGNHFQRDLAVTDIRVKATRYDPHALGLGPDTPIPVNVTVANHGTLDARAIHLDFAGFDPVAPGQPTRCSAGLDVGLLIPAGKSANLTVVCAPGLPDGSFVSFRASALALEGGRRGDDFQTDNSLTSLEVFPVRAVPDAAVVVGASPETASQDVPRSFILLVENRGNVPLQDFDVAADVFQEKGAQGRDLLQHHAWHVASTLPVGASYSIADRTHLPDVQPAVLRDRDLLFRPTDAGAFALVGRVTVDGDRSPGNDRAGASMHALDRLYAETFDGQPFMASGVVQGNRTLQGTPDVWRVERHSADGSNRLLAGDPATDEIPKDSDASVVLPDMDLTTVRSATLTFLHRYDLEPSFDAGRLEVCTAVPLDRCETDATAWRRITPVPQPVGGLPDGYPSLPLLGASPLLDGGPERSAVAFTGRSEDLAASTNGDGWIATEFNLASDAALRRTAAVEAFDLAGFASTPTATPLRPASGESQFTDPTWALNETNAQANQRFWWVDDLAYDVAPHTGTSQWWSGSAGNSLSSNKQGAAQTDLSVTIHVPDVSRPGEALVASFWDWRPGMDEGNASERTQARYGTGGDYYVSTTSLADREPAPLSTPAGIPVGSIGDGLNDADEGPGHKFPGADPMKWDTDGDGWPDGAEVCVGTKPDDQASVPRDTSPTDGLDDTWQTSWAVDANGPIVLAPTQDVERDGLTNAQEQMRCTDAADRPDSRPLFAWDSDADGRSDGQEVSNGTDPLTPFLLGRALKFPKNGDNNNPNLGLMRDSVAAIGAHAWTKREINVTSFAGQDVTLWFQYRSAQSTGDCVVIASGSLWGLEGDPNQPNNPNARYPGPDGCTPADLRARDQGNLGWFIDDLELTSYRIDPAKGLRLDAITDVSEPLDGLLQDPVTGRAGAWAASVNEPDVAGSSPRWALVGPGAASAGPRGWHVQPATVPGKGPTLAWSFSDPTDPQGYPRGQESRLVTPAIDLTNFGGSRARLQFDQHYALESQIRCAHGQSPPCTGQFTSAIDGAAIEYQVFDAASGTYGPWRQLDAGFRDFPDRLLLDAKSPGPAACPTAKSSQPVCMERVPEALSNVVEGAVPNLSRIAQTGYSAIEERGVPAQAIYEFRNDALSHWSFRSAGHGTQFEAFPGRMAPVWQWGDINAGPRAAAWLDYPVSYVFSGRSPGVGGWQNIDWDLSPLIGQKVRIGFHMASNPSYVTNDQQALDGWSIANVAVKGDVFAGKQAKLRLHLATDESLTKGEWSVDDVNLVGDRYHLNAAVLSDTPDDVLTTPGSSVVIAGRVANLGVDGRTGLALGVVATNDVTKQDYTPNVAFDATADQPLRAVTDPSTVPAGMTRVLHTFPLQPGGSSGSIVPFQVTVPLPGQAGSRIAVKVVLLENRGTPGHDLYVAAGNELPGSSYHDWILRGDTKLNVRLAPPTPGVQGLVVPNPSLPKPGEPVTLSAAVRNDGTAASGLRAQWSFVEILQKGDHTRQFGTDDERRGASQSKSQALAVVDQESTLGFQASFPVGNAGLYRATVQLVSADGTQQAVGQVEFLAGQSGQYFHTDFSRLPESAGMAGWTDASPPPSNGAGGGTPPALVFRRDGPQILWGVNDSQMQRQLTYCSPSFGAQCDGGYSNPEPPPYTGMEGMAISPPIDLRRVPQGSAVVTLRHGVNLELGDGAVLEALPLRADGQPAFVCASVGVPIWFVLTPAPDTDYGQVVQSVPSIGRQFPSPGGLPHLAFSPDLIHPLSPFLAGSGQAFGGPPVKSTTTVFALDASTPAKPAPDVRFPTRTCGAPNVTLVNYTIQLRLHVGTLPGTAQAAPRAGAEGWQVQAIDVSSTALSATPAMRIVPVRDGAAKRLGFQLANLGQVPDQVQLTLDATGSSVPDPSWITLPADPISLAPGEATVVRFGVNIPADAGLSRGDYVALIKAASLSNPDARAFAATVLRLQANPLPDLAVVLSTDDARTVPTFPAGVVAPLFVTVSNVGQLDSKPVHVQFSATREDGNETVPLDSADVPALCPLKLCNDDRSHASASVEWLVPDTPGNYTVRAEADPDGRLLEARRANNVASLRVRVIPVQAPDLVITDLVVDGAGRDGIAEQGALLTIHANVTNLGFRAANDVEVRLFSGSSELADTTLPSLQAGETRTITAFKIAAEGEYVLRAVVLPSPTELRVDNNELRRVVHVRSHDLAVRAEPAAFALDPGAAAPSVLTLTNNGTAVERITVSLVDQPGWGLLVEPNPVLVPPGGQALASVTVKAPKDAVAGLHVLDLSAAPAANPRAAVHSALQATVAALPGAPALSAPPVQAAPGPLVVRVLGQSTSNALQDLRLVLASPAWNHTAASLQLPGFANATASLVITIPPDAKPGLTSLVVKALDTAGKEVAQTTVALRVDARPAVAASWVGAPEILPGAVGSRNVRLTLHLANTGNTAVLAAAQLRDLAAGLVPDPAPPAVALAPGAAADIALGLASTADPATPLYGQAVVYLQNVTANGTGPAFLGAALDLPGPGVAPDLRIARIDMAPRQGLRAGSNLRITMAVENAGSVASPASRIEAFANGFLLDDPAVPSIPAHGQALVNLTVKFQNPGEYVLLFVADGENLVTETQKDNNDRSLTLEVAKAPLLSPRGLRHSVPGLDASELLLALGLLALLARAGPGGRQRRSR